eukprot:11657256-Prorocentrum_lima.AAC.1
MRLQWGHPGKSVKNRGRVPSGRHGVCCVHCRRMGLRILVDLIWARAAIRSVPLGAGAGACSILVSIIMQSARHSYLLRCPRQH